VSSEAFSLAGRTAVVTGATGAIGAALSRGLGESGAHVALVARRAEPLERLCTSLEQAGVDAGAWSADVLDQPRLEQVRDEVVARFGGVDLLLNVAGGNVPGATLAPGADPFGVDLAAVREVVELNLLGTVAAVLAFGPAMAVGDGADRSIVNVSSMAAQRGLTRVGGYGAAKAAVDAYTRWLAVELAQRGTGIRVNAIAPGFLLGEQNRTLLLEPDGSLTARGDAIVGRTPLGRFGEVDELVSTVIWLCSPGARFVTGAIVPVDGGFGAYGGV
jgi:NAD(P)-dependent dehydrogenase (short-subunit alcohol dehydrogenase family)